MVLRLHYLLPLLLACNQSLFDEHVGGADAGGDGDGTVPPATCPEPCVGDAVAHYNGTQGGTSGQWNYLEGGRDPLGLTHNLMTNGTWHTMTAFVGQDGSTAVLPCADNSDAQECSGIEDTLVLSPSETGGTGGSYPILSWRAPATGQFRLSGDWAGPDTYQEGVQERLVIYRNGRNDTLYTRTFATSHGVNGFDLPIEAYLGDEIRLAILANTPMSIPIGIDYFVTDLTNPGECQLLATFDDDGDITDHCNQAAYTNSNNPGAMEPPTTAGPPPAGQPRMARVFTEGSFLQPNGPAMNYDGDWTIQFWAYMEPDQWTAETFFCDWGCVEEGGVWIGRGYTGDLYFSLFYHDPVNDQCMVPATEAVVSPPPNSEWHFYRMTRSIADEEIRVCIDGAQRGQIPLGADVTMSSGIAPWLGRAVDYEPAYFRGALADVRVFQRTLPCPTLP
jgi:hypothetical protein